MRQDRIVVVLDQRSGTGYYEYRLKKKEVMVVPARLCYCQ